MLGWDKNQKEDEENASSSSIASVHHIPSPNLNPGKHSLLFPPK
jgi:hypothetical protein